jgi:hypothetical protein
VLSSRRQDALNEAVAFAAGIVSGKAHAFPYSGSTLDFGSLIGEAW